jgi:hypothetical protein
MEIVERSIIRIKIECIKIAYSKIDLMQRENALSRYDEIKQSIEVDGAVLMCKMHIVFEFLLQGFKNIVMCVVCNVFFFILLL